MTTDIERRFEEHAGKKTGAKYTRAKKAEKIVYVEKRRTRATAQKREAEIKRMEKVEKEQLICGFGKQM